MSGKHSKKRIIFVSLVLLAGLAFVFSGCAPGAPRPRGWSGAVIADNTLILGSMQGTVVAVDQSSGARLWSVPLGDSKQGGGACSAPAPTTAVYGTPAVNGNMVYVGGYIQEGNISRGKVYAFVIGQSEPRWVYPREGALNGPVVGGLVVYQNIVYFGAADGKVYALDAVDGHKIAEYQTGKIWSTPVVSNGTVYIASLDKNLYALDAEKLAPVKWGKFETGGAIVATPLVEKDTIYVGSFDRYLYAIDIVTGNLKWKFMAGNWFWAQPVIFNNTIYAPCLDHKVYILNATTGNEVAPAIDLGSPISSSPVQVGDKIVVASENGKVYTLDTASKELKQLADLGESVYAPLSSGNGILYVHTEGDALYAIDTANGAVRQFYFK